MLVGDRMTNDEKRGKFLCELRKRKKLTQQELGELIHYTDKNISKWERGISFPNNPNVLQDLAEIFDVSIEELMYGEYKTHKNESEIRNNFVSKYTDNYNLYKKRIAIILISFLLFIVIGMISVYFVFIRNSIKAYTISLNSDNTIISEINSTLLITNKINILNFSKINLKENNTIDEISLYYNDDKQKVVLFRGKNDNYYIEEKVGYEEYYLNKTLDYPVYLEINYDNNKHEVFLLRIHKKYSNDNIFPKTVAKSTEDESVNTNDINIEKLKDLGYEENQEMYIKKLSDNLVCSIDLISLNIIIQFKEDENITRVFSNLNSDDVFYEKIEKGKNDISEKIKTNEEKNCDSEKCKNEEDYAKYINYLKKVIN